jgi:hypothetical protein
LPRDAWITDREGARTIASNGGILLSALPKRMVLQ